VKSDKRRQTKLDKLEKEGGRIIRSNKNTKYIVEEREICQICCFKNHDCFPDPKIEDLRTIQDL